MGNAASGTVQSCLLSAVGGIRSNVAFQDDLFYQATAVKAYNLNFPVTPLAVTFPETSEQIAEIVRCAAENGYRVQPKSGGHSYGNYGLGGSDGAIVVDLKKFQKFDLDDTTYVATIGAGTLLEDVKARLHSAGGRAMAHGTCGEVGAGGQFTIGGLGPTSRQWGMALDHIEEMEVVLANSSIIRASKTQNPDVFFAMKGAAASFGIVTEFKVRTEPAPDMAVQYSYTINLGDSAAKAKFFKDWQAFIADPKLSRKFSTLLTLFEGGMSMSGTYFGSKAEFEAFELEKRFPVSNGGNVVVLDNWLGMVSNVAENLILQAVGGIPVSFYARSMSFTRETLIPSDTVDALFHYIDNTPKGTLVWFVIFDLEGGAINDHPVNSTAYAHRDALFWMQSYAVNLLGRVSQTTTNFLNGINDVILSKTAEAKFGVYPGYVDPLMDHAETAYWGPNLERLQEIKAAIDPNNVFQNPQSIRPPPKG